MPDHTKISKFMSLVLRHQPEVIGLQLDENGWANVDELISKMNERGKKVNRQKLEEVVQQNEKQRFRFSNDGTKIKANQGHSISVEHAFVPVEPPEILYHGTGQQNVESILRHGIDKRNRHHVHLSADGATAIKVGQRHGKPVVFNVLAGKMYRDSHLFYCSENGVWLTERVPPEYIQKTKP